MSDSIILSFPLCEGFQDRNDFSAWMFYEKTADV